MTVEGSVDGSNTGNSETVVLDPAEARKRRKAIITSQRQELEAQAAAETNAGNESDASETNPKKRKSSNASDKKTQIRYDPEVPMDKDQLAAWRREARRVRNRESAAASRQRIRSRINELEDEVDTWKTKYLEAQQLLKQMEAAQPQAAGETSKSAETSVVAPPEEAQGDAKQAGEASTANV